MFTLLPYHTIPEPALYFHFNSYAYLVSISNDLIYYFQLIIATVQATSIQLVKPRFVRGAILDKTTNDLSSSIQVVSLTDREKLQQTREDRSHITVVLKYV